MKDKEYVTERVKVHVRIRPFNEAELQQDSTTPIESLDTKKNSLTGTYIYICIIPIVRKEYDTKNFTFDTIYPETTDQKFVFETSGKYVIDVNNYFDYDYVFVGCS